MTEHKIGEVFLDTEKFHEPKKVKRIQGSNLKSNCRLCVYYGKSAKICANVFCEGVFYIETDEPLTTE